MHYSCSHQLDDQKARSHCVSAFCEQGCAPLAVYWSQTCPEHSSSFFWSCWSLGLPLCCQHHAQIASAGHLWASTVHDVSQHVLLDLYSMPAQLDCSALLYVCVYGIRNVTQDFCATIGTGHSLLCQHTRYTPFEGLTSGCSPS